MLRRSLCCVAAALACATLGCEDAAVPKAAAPEPETALVAPEPDPLYALGITIGQGFTELGLDEAEADRMARGLVDGVLARGGSDDDNARMLAQAKAFAAARISGRVRDEEMAGAFLLEAARREEGAVVHDSGMVSRVVRPGVGEPPQPNQFVVLNHHGTLRDGTVFWTTRGSEPESFLFPPRIACWREALANAAPGAVLHLTCPPSLAFGNSGLEARGVPGGAVLSFELELVEVTDEL